MYDNVWLCMTVYDYVWLWMTIYAYVWLHYVWLCLTIYNFIWLCLTMYDCVWLCMTRYDYIWLGMNMYEAHFWCFFLGHPLCMTKYEYVWPFIPMYVYVWLCMTVYDYVLLVGFCMKPKNATKKKYLTILKLQKIWKINEKGKKLNPHASISTLCLLFKLVKQIELLNFFNWGSERLSSGLDLTDFRWGVC